MSERSNADGVDTSIRPLDEDTVARIAAGEVVERPASAVKELLENSLDADAGRVDVAVTAGGTESIRVTDDGLGMTAADVRAAVRQHTTSKIADLEDLESGVETLGFRGEALHTIGSVSRLTIRTRPREDHPVFAGVPEEAPGAGSGSGGSVSEGSNSEGSGSEDSGSPPADPTVGTELRYEGGEVIGVEPVGCPPGTVVEVEDIFFNTPARRKFLKATATEFAHVSRIVTRYALANPDVAISLSHDGREVFATDGGGDRRAAVLAVYGREVAEAMIEVDADAGSLSPGPLQAVTGLVSHPETNRASREYCSTYVNGRAVRSAAVMDGIMEAYGDQLGPERYPFAALFLAVPPESVDVNVHPRKRTVRFEDEPGVRRQIAGAVRSALREHGLVRSRAPRGRSAPGETAVTPGDAGGDPDASDGPGAEPDGPIRAGADPDASAGPGGDRKGIASGDDDQADAPEQAASTDAGRSLARGSPTESATTSPTGADAGEASPTGADVGEASPTDSPDGGGRPPANTVEDSSREHRSTMSATPTQRTLEGSPTPDAPAFQRLPRLRVLGQLADTYVVCETPEGLALVDQHAADERIHFERLRTAFRTDDTAQALASPVELALTPEEEVAFERYRAALEELGFVAEPSGDRRIAVTAVPAVLEERVEPERLRDALGAALDGDVTAANETVDAVADALLADLACHPAVTGNTSLTEGSVLALLEALDECENPWSCPHGRPTIVEIDGDELDARFERDYPGHGG